jgi:hypothetical protein
MQRRRPRLLVVHQDPQVATALSDWLQNDWDVTAVSDVRGLPDDITDRVPYDVVLESLPQTYPRLVVPVDYRIALSPNDDLYYGPLAGATRIVFGGSSDAADGAHLFGALYLPEPLDPSILKSRLAAAREKALIYRDTFSEPVVRTLQLQIVEVNDELLRYLAEHPDALRQLHWRSFEEMIARLLERSGFKPSLQRGSKDGGVDIIAANHVDIGNLVMLVQCKQTRSHVGVEVVRQLYGVVQQQRASIGLVATTSYFTRDAIEFQRPISATLTLRDFDEIANWLKAKRP